MTKKRLLVSFSGGETSAYMAQWLWNNKQDEYEMIFVFANTGFENEETLQFVDRCEKHFGFPVVWIEAKVFPKMGNGNSFTKIDFYHADRDATPFREMIKKHGIPNQNNPHCTRELKGIPIKKYAASLGWKHYYTAIGIREDEIDRMSKNRAKQKFVYPLITMRPMTKPKINFWWTQQPFRLELKGYQGNCITCWKKGDNKLYQIAKENDKNFNFFGEMEAKYSRFTPESRIKIKEKRGELEHEAYPIVFFRKNRSAIDIVNEAKQWHGTIKDDSQELDFQLDLDNGACEIFTECGIDN